ncbi:hypothetical protein T492DRAFT_1145275 [Pavlovales sp. CCMP2436]|nr:hypothetical protein T492DRAFT_1145275 [Pavlovales sp. CCMP2436]
MSRGIPPRWRSVTTTKHSRGRTRKVIVYHPPKYDVAQRKGGSTRCLNDAWGRYERRHVVHLPTPTYAPPGWLERRYQRKQGQKKGFYVTKLKSPAGVGGPQAGNLAEAWRRHNAAMASSAVASSAAQTNDGAHAHVAHIAVSPAPAPLAPAPIAYFGAALERGKRKY